MKRIILAILLLTSPSMAAQQQVGPATAPTSGKWTISDVITDRINPHLAAADSNFDELYANKADSSCFASESAFNACFDLTWATGGSGSMIYPGAGVPNSTGSAWGTSYTVGTSANNLVQLNGSAQLPAVSAALLTNFPTLNQSTTGNAATATALAANPTDCSAGQYATTIAANGNLTCAQVAYSQISSTPTIPTVSDTAYDATSWNGNTDAPTKNAIRDKIETIAGGTMTYPGAGVANSTGSAWGTSYTVGTSANNLIQLNSSGELPFTIDLSNLTDTTNILAGKQSADADLTIWAGVTPGTGVATALAVNVGSAGAPVLFNGAGGTPSSLTLTNATGLPASSVGNGFYVADDCTTVSNPATGAICFEY